MRIVCVICTDHIEEDFSATRCGHTFHFECLNQWLLHRKNCPQCRETCRPKDVIKLFVTSNDLTQNNDLQSMDPKDMREKLSLQERLMTQKDNALEESRSLLDDIQQEMKAWQLQHKETHKRLKAEQASSSILKKQLMSMQHELGQVKGLRSETERLRTRVSTLEGVERMLKGSNEEINELVTNSTPAKLATVIVGLKKDYDILREKRVSLMKERDKLAQIISHTKKNLQNKEKELQISQDQVLALESDMHAAEEEKRTLQRKVEMLQSAIDSPGSRHALKRMLESPMPNLITQKPPDVGASPLLTSVHSRHPLSVENTTGFVGEPKLLGVKRSFSSKENNIVMPVPKMSKNGLSLKPKAFSSKIMKKDLKFAPRKNFLCSKK